MTELAAGEEFAGHRIEGVAGRGGMGVVYRARQLDLDRLVALKLIAPALAQDQAFRDRFVRESRAAAAIDDPHVIPIHYAGEQRRDAVHRDAPRRGPGPADARARERTASSPSAPRASSRSSRGALDAAHATGSSTATSSPRTSSSAPASTST